MKWFTVPITWLNGIDHGEANGYVAIPKGHKYYGVHYNEIDVDVHGGLTFSEYGKDCPFPKNIIIGDDEWVVGFDTAHCGDTQYTWPLERVKAEAKRLAAQLEVK